MRYGLVENMSVILPYIYVKHTFASAVHLRFVFELWVKPEHPDETQTGTGRTLMAHLGIEPSNLWP